jgi:hypothetical protein
MSEIWFWYRSLTSISVSFVWPYPFALNPYVGSLLTDSLSQTSATITQWSVPATLIYRPSNMSEYRHDMIKPVLSSHQKEVEVYLWRMRCGNTVLMITMLFKWPLIPLSSLVHTSPPSQLFIRKYVIYSPYFCSSRTPTIMTEDFRSFPKPLEGNASIIP